MAMANEYCVEPGFNHREFRHKVKDAMKDKHVNVTTLAKKTGYSKNTIYNYMCGNYDSKYLPIGLAKVLKIKLEERKNDDG